MSADPPDKRKFDAPPSGELPREEAAMPYAPEDSVTDGPAPAIERARRTLERRLLGIEAVTGIILDQDARGEAIFLVYLRDESARARIPAAIDGVPVIAKIGEFDAYAGPGDGPR